MFCVFWVCDAILLVPIGVCIHEGQFLVGIIGTDRNPLTSDTRIRFTAGSLSPTPGKPNRIFLDNVYLRKITSNAHVQDEDLFLLNGGKSGKDTVFQKDENNE